MATGILKKAYYELKKTSSKEERPGVYCEYVEETDSASEAPWKDKDADTPGVGTRKVYA